MPGVDLVLVPVVLLPLLALRAVHQGDPRRHGHLMTGALGCLALRGALGGLTPSHRMLGSALLGLLVLTALLGRAALAWREGHPGFARIPRLHRTLGALSLLCLALALAAWLLTRWA